MKKILSIILMLSMILSLVACTNSDKSNEADDEPTESYEDIYDSETSYETETDVIQEPTVAEQEKEYKLTEYTKSFDFEQGYTCDATLKIGSWIKVSDTERIEQAWKAVGGHENLPDLSQFNINKYATYKFFEGKENTSIMVFGTISVKNTTAGGFSLSDSLNFSTWGITVNAYDMLHSSLVDSYVEYGSNGKFRHNYDNVSGSIVVVHPKIEGDNWGPVPFVICCADALTPESPDGKPQIYKSVWGFGADFNVYPEWTDEVPTELNGDE